MTRSILKLISMVKTCLTFLHDLPGKKVWKHVVMEPHVRPYDMMDDATIPEGWKDEIELEVDLDSRMEEKWKSLKRIVSPGKSQA
jgi:hypothetical protein